MAELKLSDWIIILAFFSAVVTVGVSLIVSVNTYYPSNNISADWESSFDKMDNIEQSTSTIRESITSGEESKITLLGTAEAIWSGTTNAIMNGLGTIGLIDDMIADFEDESNISWPIWAAGLIITIIVIRLIFNVISAWLKRGV